MALPVHTRLPASLPEPHDVSNQLPTFRRSELFDVDDVDGENAVGGGSCTAGAAAGGSWPVRGRAEPIRPVVTSSQITAARSAAKIISKV